MIPQKQFHKPDLLFVINDFEFFKTHRSRLIAFLASEGLLVTVATNLKEASSDEVEIYTKKRISFIDFNLHRSSINPLRNIMDLTKLFLIIFKIKPKKLFLVSSKPIIFGGISALLLGIKDVFFSISGLGYVFINEGKKNQIIKKIILGFYKAIFSISHSKVIFQNEDDKGLLLGLGVLDEDKAILIKGNGIDTDQFKKNRIKEERIGFLFASRLLVDKGIKEFLEASKNIDKNLARFVIAGDLDPLNPQSLKKSEFEEYKKNKRFLFLGKIDHTNMNSVFNECHVFVLPSYREGLPQVALEAAACEMPLILSDVEGCRECILDKKTGFLVKKKNIEQLTEKMNYFLENPEQISEKGKASREFVLNNFSKETIFHQYLKLFSKF
jgi:glycosyltransferase involved in cell wall biosynthesis